MPYVLDQSLDLQPRSNQKYFISSAHRRNQPNKSRWTVDLNDEVECFILSQENSWIEDVTAWGILKPADIVFVLGENTFQEPLQIAKFITKNDADAWHGYPADFVRKLQDRPGMSILIKWRNKGHIHKHHMVKIRQGKECDL